MDNQPSYFATIPAPVRYCKQLEPSARLLYGELTALANRHGYCWASNEYFSELYGVDERTVRRWLESLSKEGFIEIEYKQEGIKRHRKIWIVSGIKNMFTDGHKDPKGSGDVRTKTPAPSLLYNNTQEQQQQNAALAAAVSSEKKPKIAKPTKKEEDPKIFGMLEKLSIPLIDITWLCKHFDAPTIEHSIAWATHPQTQIKQSLVQALKWACVNLPQIPKSKIDSIEENKAFASQMLKKSKLPSTDYIELLSSYIEIGTKGGNFQPICLTYQEAQFKEKLQFALRRYL